MKRSGIVTGTVTAPSKQSITAVSCNYTALQVTLLFPIVVFKQSFVLKLQLLYQSLRYGNPMGHIGPCVEGAVCVSGLGGGRWGERCRSRCYRRE